MSGQVDEKLKSERTGEKNINCQGLSMSILEYRNARDIDVIFENGHIVKNKYYLAFKNGQIRDPKWREGQVVLQKSSNLEATIINYRHANDMDIMFDDGTVVEHIGYKHFKNGGVRHPNLTALSRIGEVSLSNKGQKMEIISWHSTHDTSNSIDVRFEDGTIVRNKTYHSFKNGGIKNPNFCEFIGQSVVCNNGQKLTIVKYKSSKDFDAEFEDGTVVHLKDKGRFNRGEVRNPNVSSRMLLARKRNMGRVGKSKFEGLTMKVVEYRTAHDITVEFLDEIKVKTSISNFNSGSVSFPYGNAVIGNSLIRNFAYMLGDEPNFYVIDLTTGERDIRNVDEMRVNL
jgi:hypothetical protein